MVNLKRIATWLFVAVILAVFFVPVATSQNFLGLVPTDRLLGRDSAGDGEVEPITVSGALSFTGSGGITASAADILTQLLTVDGSGSGLDADLLDGVSSAGFLQDFNFTDDAATAGLSITEAETMTFAGDPAGIDTAGSGNTLTISFDVTEAEANIESAIDTLANLVSVRGLTVTRADAGANAFFGWDDTAGAYENLTNPEAIAALGIDLGTDTTGDYVKDVADGTGIDGTATGEGSTYTPSFDATEISSATWGAGSFTSFTFDAGVTDPVLTFGSNSLAISSAIVSVDQELNPDADGGADLGTTALAWDDLFLDTGATINFDAGNWLFTHS